MGLLTAFKAANDAKSAVSGVGKGSGSSGSGSSRNPLNLFKKKNPRSKPAQQRVRLSSENRVRPESANTKQARARRLAAERRAEEERAHIQSLESMSHEERIAFLQQQAQQAVDEETPVAPWHTFRLHIENISVRGVLPFGRRTSNVFIKFSFGAPAPPPKRRPGEEEEEEIDESILRVPPLPRARVLRTPIARDISSGGNHEYSSTSFSRNIDYCYEHLPKLQLLVEAYHKRSVFKSELMGSSSIRLSDLANGNIEQEHQMELHETSGRNARHQTSCVLNFRCFFQEKTHYHLQFLQWRARKLVATDSSRRFDPFVKFAIARDWRKFFRRGGFFFRRGRSPITEGDDEPLWSEAGGLWFYGTKSELESEELYVDVLDSHLSATGRPLGKAIVPLRGVLDYGYIDAELGLLDKATEILIPAGMIEGYVAIDGVPAHSQYGESVIPRAGRQYVVIKIESASRLRAADPTGLSDPFVVVSWDGMKQQSKVVERTLDPVFNDVLYFPIKLIDRSPDAIARRGPLLLEVFDWDDAGNDFLGSHQLPLSQITAGPREKGGYTFDGSVKLKRNGEETSQQLKIQVYFHPDVHGPIPDFEREERVSMKEIDARAEQWRLQLPPTENRQFQYAAPDEFGISRFLPQYLCPLPPPLSFRDPLRLFRMVHCMMHESDQAALDADDVWSSPNFFMSLTKGDSEDHAILLCNLFLGLGLDAYLCVGRNQYNQEHTWVMTRMKDDSIVFWETLNGRYYRLPARWNNPAPPAPESPEATLDELRDQSVPSRAQIEKREKKEKLRAKLEKKKEELRKELEEFEKHEAEAKAKAEAARALIEGRSPADDATSAAAPPPADAPASAADRPVSPADVAVETPKSAASRRTLSRATSSPLDGDQAGLSRSGSSASRRRGLRASSSPAIDAASAEPVPTYDFQPVVFFEDEAALPDKAFIFASEAFSGKLRATNFFDSLKQTTNDSKHYDLLMFEPADKEEPMPHVLPLPYRSLDVVVGPENLWANVGNADATTIKYDLDDERKWAPFMSFSAGFVRDIGPFYYPRHLSPPVSPLKLQLKEYEIFKVLQASVTMARHRESRDTTFVRRLRPVISEGLRLMERQFIKRKDQSARLDAWKGRLQEEAPPGYTFQGVPVHFCYADANKIRTHFLNTYDLHKEDSNAVLYAAGVHIQPYWNGVLSVWAMLCKMMPLPSTNPTAQSAPPPGKA